MHFGIMSAMPEEVQSLLPHIKNLREITHGNRTFYQGQIYTHNVTLVFSRWGKVAAAATVTALITEFKIEKLIFTGVAGALSPLLNIGDLVVSDRLYQHDMDASPLFPVHEIPLTGVTFFQAEDSLKNQAMRAVDLLISNIQQIIQQSVLSNFYITTPKCILGDIATGDRFIADPKLGQALLKSRPDTYAVEMEGAAVAQVCHDYQLPFVVIRTISDKADHIAGIDFPKFIEQIATQYSEHIILAMMKGV